MESRGTWESFIVALPVAFFSGIGVAVALLDDQTASMVGVAISAALLPPAVNAGIMWVAYAYAKQSTTFAPAINSDCACYVQKDDENALEQETFRLMGVQTTLTAAATTSFNVDPEHTRDYYYDSGLISLFLTLANILLIMVSSMFLFRLKEILPIRKNIFWSDLGIARKIYQKKALVQRVTSSGHVTPLTESGESIREL